jgi:NADPH:quinone reductase-like Zn-dependent oxidoreductase
MRAVVHDQYGPPEVLRVAEVAQPVPKEDEVLVRVHASTVARSTTDLRSLEYLPVHPSLHRHRPERGRPSRQATPSRPLPSEPRAG